MKLLVLIPSFHWFSPRLTVQVVGAAAGPDRPPEKFDGKTAKKKKRNFVEDLSLQRRKSPPSGLRRLCHARSQAGDV